MSIVHCIAHFIVESKGLTPHPCNLKNHIPHAIAMIHQAPPRRLLAVVAATAATLFLAGRARPPPPPPGALPLPMPAPAPDDPWAHNLAALARHCARTAESWDRISRGRFRETVQYDDVEAHKTCWHARGLGCAHGSCRHAWLRRGCLNSRRDRCCDDRHKRCTILSRDPGSTPVVEG